MILTVIVFIVILALLVLSHEIGHFVAAKKAGVKIEEFGFGFPPRLLSFKKGETIYSLNLIPLGGFVKIYGEDGQHKEDSRSFSSQSVRQRFQMLISGVLMNIVLAIFLLTILSIFVYPWYQGLWMGLVNTFYLIGLIIIALAQLFWQLILTGRFQGEVFGPVGIASLTGKVVEMGFLNVLYFTALLSINLAIINVLPFPALDGGRLLFLAIEKIKGKPVSQKTEKAIHTAGFALLILLMLIVTFRDIQRFL